MIHTLRLIPPILVVGMVAFGVSELLYRGWVGASARWNGEPELLFELYTYGLPPGTGESVSRLLCGKLEGLPIVVRRHDEARELRNALLYRIRKRPSAALIRLPERQEGEPSALEPVLRRSLLWSDVLKPRPELGSLRRRLLLESRAHGALPILAGGEGSELARALEVPAASAAEPAALAQALGALFEEKPRCLPGPTVGR